MYTISEGLFKTIIPFCCAVGFGFLLWVAWSVVKSAITKAKRTKPNYSDEVNRLLELDEHELLSFHKEQSA